MKGLSARYPKKAVPQMGAVGGVAKAAGVAARAAGTNVGKAVSSAVRAANGSAMRKMPEMTPAAQSTMTAMKKVMPIKKKPRNYRLSDGGAMKY